MREIDLDYQYEDEEIPTIRRSVVPTQELRTTIPRGKEDIHPFRQYITSRSTMPRNDTNRYMSYTCKLNTIVEETEKNIKNEIAPNSKPIHSSRKRKKSINKQRNKSFASVKSYRVTAKVDARATGQNDTGANRNVTNDKSILMNYRDLKRSYPVSGIQADAIALQCTGIGYLPWRSETGEYIYIKTYYCKEAEGTIISPNAVARQYADSVEAVDVHMPGPRTTNYGYTAFTFANGKVMQFSMYRENDLWYHTIAMDTETTHTKHEISKWKEINANTTGGQVKAMNNRATYALWHHRLGHPGKNTMRTIHEYVDGIPKFKGMDLWSCECCNRAKFDKKPLNTKDHHKATAQQPQNPHRVKDRRFQIGEGLHMDFGFVRGSTWKQQDENGQTITSINGYRAYLLVVDRATRYKWIFLSKSKKPPIAMVRGLLQRLDCKATERYIMTDQGGELARSEEFRSLLATEFQYGLRYTGAGNSESNGLVERPHRDLSNRMRAMLHGAALGPEYWSYAITHAVYLLNRQPHSAMKMTPHEALTGKRPNLNHLRTFGSKVFAYKPGARKAKLDFNNSSGIFLHFGASDKLLVVKDDTTGKEKYVRHAGFDELHMGTPSAKRPPFATTLIDAGYANDTEIDFQPSADTVLKVQLLSTNGTIPTRGSTEAAGLDLYSAHTTIIQPHKRALIPTDIAIECPIGTYLRIAPRSGLAVKKGIDVLAGVIDSDYRGNVQVALINHSDHPVKILQGDKMAQAITTNIEMPTITIVNELSQSQRGAKGFGSSDKKNKATSSIPRPNLSEMDITKILTQHGARAAVAKSTTTTWNAQQIQLSTCPYDNCINIQIPQAKGADRKEEKDFGLCIELCPHRNLPYLVECRKSTRAARIIRWRSTIKGGYIKEINGFPVTTTEECYKHLSKAHSANEAPTVTFGLLDRATLHPHEGVPLVYFDQLQLIGKHLHEMKIEQQLLHEDDDDIGGSVILQEDETDMDENNNEGITINRGSVPDVQESTAKERRGSANSRGSVPVHASKGSVDSRGSVPATEGKEAIDGRGSAPNRTTKPILPKSKSRKNKLSRRKLKLRDDWKDWNDSEMLQLDQYEKQQMFGQPTILPEGANCLPLLWTYLHKDDGRKKARCVCNGSPSRKGTVTLGHTYASSLDQNGARIFWAAAALKNHRIYAADVSNAFAEAPPPKAPLYVRIDEQYREWWINKGNKPIPRNLVLPVKRALQGHPESSRLWAILINNILVNELNLQPTKHEPCLYHGTFKGKEILFLRQVDDFAIACESETIAKELLAAINTKMSVNIKYLGLVDRFNGVDIDQKREYIKIHNKTYIRKILKNYAWIWKDRYKPNNPLPMKAEHGYQKLLEEAPTPMTPDAITALQHKMGFNYRQAIGELLYAMVTCRPDISYPVIKLSQYSNNPGELHYEAIKNVLTFLHSTQDEGIIYWRTEPNQDLPHGKIPTVRPDTRETAEENKSANPAKTQGCVDSDWAGDTSHRRSVTGYTLELAGGTIFYKSKFQETVATSSCEAEFTAACEAAKSICYVRSILDEINIPQTDATTLFIDNQGALLMADAQQPTKRTRHIDIKHFKIQEWVEQDIIAMKKINTHDNRSDAMTKALNGTLFYRHMDRIMGRIIPSYVRMDSTMYTRTHSLDHQDSQENGGGVTSTTIPTG